MRALLTDEQQDLAKMVGDLAAVFKLSNPEQLDTVDRAEAWRALCETGLVALRQRDSQGVPEAGGVEVALIAEGLARELVPVPFLTSAVMSVELLEAANAQADIIADAAADSRYTVAVTPDLTSLSAASGHPAIAIDAGEADFILLCGGAGHPVQRVERPATGLLDSADLTRSLYTVSADDAETVSDPVPDEAYTRWLAVSLTALACDIVGTTRGALDRVVEYSTQRVQFGVRIGSFQAIQHLCAEATAKVESAWSAAKYAAWAVDELDPDAALLAARVAKASASSIARPVSETVMQVYGGIGQTWESIAHVQLRRTLLSRALLGDENAQLDAIADAKLGRS